MWYFALGDAGFYFAEQLKGLSWLPAIWRPELGQSHLDRLWFQYPYDVTIKALSSVGLPWWLIDKFLWALVLVLGIYGAYKLATHILGKGYTALLSSLIYISNTYILLLFNGGQIGVALAYAFAPFVFYRIIKFSNSGYKEQLINGLLLALLVSFDLRIASLVVLATPFWWYRSLISFVVAGVLHMFWILPVMLASGGVSDLGGEFTNPGMLKFLSVADFSHALALLHPNWPENLFGRVYFLQPEFLILPILAFSALFVNKLRVTGNELNAQHVTRNYITYFALLALVGAFFAKGVNPPAGGIFEWLFVHIPGFVMFRDPTKFYLYTAVGYSILIPYALQKINRKLVYAFFIIFWMFTLRGFSAPVVLVPKEYTQFKDVLATDSEPSRTLWIPQRQSFSYYSDIHPILVSTAGSDIDKSVKYVVVPVDTNKRMFLTDYKFDPSIREKVISDLSGRGLARDTRFSSLAVFVNPEFSGLQQAVPAQVERQQQLSNIGLVVSVGSLVLLLLWIFLH